MSVYELPAINASLNAVSGAFVIAGWLCIRSGRTAAHVACMIAALVSSAAFLTCYLYYHAHAGSVRFTHPGPVKSLYLALLLTHTVAATVCLPMVIATVVPALRRRFERHKAIARWTLPLWLYVSVTGVLVYCMLYQWFPAAEALRRRAEIPSESAHF